MICTGHLHRWIGIFHHRGIDDNPALALIEFDITTIESNAAMLQDAWSRLRLLLSPRVGI